MHRSTVAAGSSDVELTFRVPNERADANTVQVPVYFPITLPLLTVDVLPVPGWTDSVQTQNQPKPVQTDDGPVNDIVADVTWKATAGGIAPRQYQDFDIAAGSMPSKAGALVFKALQSYSSGEIVRWIEVPVAGQPEPDLLAPVLTLTAPAAGAATRASPAHAASSGSSGSSGTDGVAIAALVLGVVNLAGMAVLTVRPRRDQSGARATT